MAGYSAGSNSLQRSYVALTLLGLLFPERRGKWNRDPLFIRSRGLGDARREKRKERREVHMNAIHGGTGTLVEKRPVVEEQKKNVAGGPVLAT